MLSTHFFKCSLFKKNTSKPIYENEKIVGYETNLLMAEQPNVWELVKAIQELQTELCNKDSSYEFC